MNCPFCNSDNSRVINSRTVSNGGAVRRRRICVVCDKRFTTYERVEESPIVVIKKDKRREEFKREKILKGLQRATEKRNISRETIEEIVIKIEREIQNNLKGEVSSKQIGTMMMTTLKELDEVAYVRFASVYKEFKDLESFMKEIKNFKDK